MLSGLRFALWYSPYLMTEVQRHFLGWDSQFIPTASKWLLENYLDGGLGSAERLLILVPGQAVANRLQSEFINVASKDGRAAELPRIVTTSQFFKLLIPDDIRIADLQSTVLATVVALKELPQNAIQKIVGKRLVDEEDFLEWVRFATKVLETINVATGGGLSIDSTTWPRSDRLELTITPAAIDRFSVLQEVQNRTQELLLLDNVSMFDVEQLALIEIDSTIQLGITSNIVVVGGSDLSSVTTKLLTRLLSEGIQVESLIRAPKSEENGFDTFGCIDTKYWMSAKIDIEEENIVVAGSPSSQAAEVVRALSELDSEITSEQITITSTDEKLIPILKCHIQGHGIRGRFSGGMSVLQTPEALLLLEIASFISTQSYASYASIARHPEIVRLLSIKEKTLANLSEYSATVVPTRISDSKWFIPTKYRNRIDGLFELHKGMFGLFGESIAKNNESNSITNCATAIRELLLTVYGGEELDRASSKLKALQKIFGVLDSLESISDQLCSKIDGVHQSDVIRLMLSELDQTTISELPDPIAIDIVGWLEGMASDSPHLLVVGMSSDLAGRSTSDAYFPDNLLDVLGLETMDRRMARDAHAMIAMQNSRSNNGSIKWIVGRKNTEGDPLSPSPLLMRCDEPISLAKRSGDLVLSFDKEQPVVPPQFANLKIGTGLQIPKPSEYKTEPLTQLRVTAFKEFLACEYRFWLKNVLKLGESEDGLTELDAKLFGTFMHSVLQQFGEDEKMKHCSNAKKIESFVSATLDDVVKEKLGPNVSAKIAIQLELARYRLKEFAIHQAKSVKDGWTIVCTERFVKKELDVKGNAFTIRGTIDRVETNALGQVRVLDYKTGSMTANKAHFNKTEWKDLQLPLYRLLLTKIPELSEFDLSDENVSLGYFKIGDQTSSSGIDLLTPKPELSDDLSDFIDTTILSIISNKFSDTPEVPAPKFNEQFSWVCQDNSVVEESSDTTYG